jgi:DNA-binding transcriptional regulator YhcF (GntR family)
VASFKFDDSILFNPKFQDLSAPKFKQWVNLKCIGSRSSPRWRLPSIREVGRQLGMKPHRAQELLDYFVEQELLASDRDAYYFPDEYRTESAQKAHKKRTKISKSSKKTKDLREKSERKKGVVDAAFDFFAAAFQRARATPYLGNQGDFVQLSRLRKALKIGGKETPPGWEKAVSNYFESEQGAFTVRFLVQHFDQLVRTPIDRYNKPLAQGGLFNGKKEGALTSRGEHRYTPKQR